MDMKKKNTRRFATGLLVIAVVVAAFSAGFILTDTDYFFKINKSIDIFGRVYREITLNYVDQVDPEKFMEAGIDGLLGALDPYTNYIGEQEADEVELITVGKYGGIGVTIGMRDGYITIISLMEGYAAQRQGLQPGDRILEIDGKTITGLKPANIRLLTHGEPGTEVHLKIERENEPNPLDFVVMREEIQLKNITYADYAHDGIGYVRLERFSRGAGDELGLAIKDLKLKGSLKGLILDLRGNPGGLLDVAVNVVEKFAAKGNLVVSTRGRTPDSEKKYFVSEDPMLPDIPIVVLVNRQSASASEIVAGAIQDLDRGVILGTRSFGKGLVQTIVPLVYNSQMKITTAKYYTPSGRCIQEIDYMHKNKDGVFAVTPDSLKKIFKTLNGRSVLEAGGIQPDSVVADSEHSGLYDELNRKSLFYKFASKYTASHSALPPTFNADSLLIEFKSFLSEQKFTYQDDVEKKLTEMCGLAGKCNYSKEVQDEIGQLKKNILAEKEKSILRYQNEILSALRPEITGRIHGEKGKIEESLKDDRQVQTAVGLLFDSTAYHRILNVQ
jgi:carboxyl-terminal processing protease